MNIQKKFYKLSTIRKSIVTAILLTGYFISNYFLEISYQNSLFPVPYFDQQTSFNAIKMKEWYAYMIENNSFSVYIQTQFIDFIFIMFVILGGFCLWSLLNSFHKQDSKIQRIGKVFSWSLPLAGIFDILENIVSFFMITNPVNFNNTLIYIYSGFASIKFFFWTIGMGWFILSFGLLLIFSIYNKTKK